MFFALLCLGFRFFSQDLHSLVEGGAGKAPKNELNWIKIQGKRVNNLHLFLYPLTHCIGTLHMPSVRLFSWPSIAARGTPDRSGDKLC